MYLLRKQRRFLVSNVAERHTKSVSDRHLFPKKVNSNSIYLFYKIFSCGKYLSWHSSLDATFCALTASGGRNRTPLTRVNTDILLGHRASRMERTGKNFFLGKFIF